MQRSLVTRLVSNGIASPWTLINRFFVVGLMPITQNANMIEAGRISLPVFLLIPRSNAVLQSIADSTLTGVWFE